MAKTWSYKADAVQREKFCKWLGGYLLELSGRQLVDDFGDHYHLVTFCPRQEPDRHDIKSFPVWFADRLAKEQNLSFVGFTVEFLCEDGDLFDLNFYFEDAGAITGLRQLGGKIRLTLTMTGSDDKFSKLYSEIDRRIERHFPGSRLEVSSIAPKEPETEETRQETEPPTTAEAPAAEQATTGNPKPRRGRKNLSDDQQREIAEFYLENQSNMSYEQVGDRFAVSGKTVQRYVDKFKLS